MTTPGGQPMHRCANSVDAIDALIRDLPHCLLTTVDPSGGLASRPMTVVQSGFTGDLRFCCDRHSRKVAQIRRNPRVSVTFRSDRDWVSINGDAEVVDDPETVRTLWSPRLQPWFPTGSHQDSMIAIIVRGRRAEHWRGDTARVPCEVRLQPVGDR